MPKEEPNRVEESAKVAARMDRHAFAREYQAVYRRLWLIAAGVIGHSNDADDIVQEAAVIAFRRLDEFRKGSNFPAWVSEIVRRAALNHRKKAVRRKTYATDPNELDQHQTTQVSTRFAADQLSAIDFEIDDDMFRVLNQLPDDARCCMLLRVVDELPYAEISLLLGIPEGTAMSHVHRSKKFARERLRHLFSDNGGPT